MRSARSKRVRSESNDRKSAGSGHGLRRRLRVFADPEWTDWLPTYAWVIDHPEGIIVVDTGQGTHLLDSGQSLHPYLRWEVEVPDRA